MTRDTAARGALVLATSALLVMTAKDWSATINPLGGSTMTGTATARPHEGDSLTVAIQIRGARRGDSNPWHVHAGGCDSSGAIIGEPSRYVPMNIGPDQTGQATAVVRAALTVGVPYSVNVHRSPSDQTVVACGNLRPVAGY